MNKIVLAISCALLTCFILLLSYKVGLFSTDLTENQEQTIDFLNGNQELSLNYSESEFSHLVDVKELMQGFDILFYLLLLFCTLTLTYYKRKQENLKKILYYGGILTLSLAGVILILVIVNFNFAFTFFHSILFPQGNWLFPENSLLIQIFPIGFFVAVSVKIFLLAIGLAILIIILSKRTVFID